jgi:hypothetical protein
MAEMQLRVTPGLEWRTPTSAATDLIRRVEHDEAFALDVVDWVLQKLPLIFKHESREDRTNAARRLNFVLELAGSAWEVHTVEGVHGLSRRAVGPVVDAIEAVRSDADRAGAHLSDAWIRAMGRNPDPTGAYREAVRAVEAAAKPILSPNDKLFTLGKGIAAIRSKPAKWTFALGTPEQVADMCSVLWKSQFDRHGTDDEFVPLSVSQTEADAAIYLAITLVRWFSGGAFRVSA